MSTFTPTAQNSAVTEADSTDEAIETFVSTVTDALAECGASDETVASVETAGQQLAERVREDQDRRDSERDHAARERAELAGRVSDVEDDVNADETGEEADVNATNPTPDGVSPRLHDAITPLEKVTRMNESAAQSSLSRNQDRARAVFRDVIDYTQSVPKGRAISTPDLRRVLTAFRDGGTACYKTVSRVVDFLTEMGKDDVWTKERMNGDTVVVFSDDICKRRAAYQNQASGGDSVVSGERVAD
jgi:hypothetical protein